VREPSWRTRRIEEARPAWLRKIAKLGGHDPHAKCETISMVAFEVLDASHPEENARRERERRISKAVAKLQGILARRDAAEREVAIAFLGDPAEFLAEKRFQSFLERYKDPLDSVDRFRRNLRGLNRAKKLKLSSEIIDRLAYRLLAASIAVRKMHAGKGYLEPLKELVKDAQRLRNHVAWALADFLLANGMAPESARLTAEECLPLIGLGRYRVRAEIPLQRANQLEAAGRRAEQLARELLQETGGDPQEAEGFLDAIVSGSEKMGKGDPHVVERARRYIDAVPMIREMIYTVASEDTKLESDLRLYRRMREKSQSSRQA